MRRIAVIEDDQPTNDHLAKLLRTLADVHVVQAVTREAAEALISSSQQIDLAIVDIDLGQTAKNRYAGLKLIASFGKLGCPTIVVSGISEQNLHDVSLTLSAYDFIEKPITDLDFINKVEHALDWAKSNASQDLFGTQNWPEGLTEDTKKHLGVLWRGKPVRLTLTELRIVHCLAAQAGRVVEHRRLITAMKSSASKEAIATHVTGIRKKFREIDDTFDHIDSEPGKGYVWKSDR